MDIYIEKGAHIDIGDFKIAIDPTKKPHDVDLILISHAHSDHYTKSIFNMEQPKLMSVETFEIFNARFKDAKEKIKNCQLLNENKQLKFGNFNKIKISAFYSGHCVGSLQFLIEYKDRRIVYTGDFCLENRMGFKRGNILKGTDLIIDSTYFDTLYRFPPRNQIYVELLKWLKYRLIDCDQQQIIIFGRRLGTCQELTSLLNFCSLKREYNLKIYVHPLVFRINNIHSSYYENLGEYEYLKSPFIPNGGNGDNSEDEIKVFGNVNIPCKEKSVYIAPFYLSYRKQIEKVFPNFNIDNFGLLTGWTLNKEFYLKGFPLSSHAGYDHILYYKEKCGARNVYLI
ncbi:MAG: MBL fold metallo-hydrolase [Candidatus Helarchaeota archaeon]